MTLGAYLHVPFCASRCGYCDFNTYTAAELQRDGTTVTAADYHQWLVREIEWTRGQWPGGDPIDTVFIGGGTPTLLAPTQIGAALTALRNHFGLADSAEVTIEANPDSVDQRSLGQIGRAHV